MRHCTSKRIRHSSTQPTVSIVHQDLFYENENISDKVERHLNVQESKKKNRPPLLKCPTWPENSIQQDVDSKNYSSPDTKVDSNSKLDSPSFYSSQIDFSAISHLSEEHDRLMAQEKAEKSCNKHTCASSKTKERHYGKMTQRNGQANRKTRQDSNNESSYTISSTAFDGPVVSPSNVPSTVRQPIVGEEVNNNVTVSRRSINEILSKRSLKSGGGIPSVEKAFRKRHPSSCGITVTSTPYTTLQNDNNLSSVTVDSEPMMISDAAETEETHDELKKSLHIPVEKQPLPPEGFKISRYPLKQPSRQSSPIDSYDQNSPDDADLHRTISDLQRQLDRAQDRISELERQARGWKETAQQTLRAAQVIKSQLASEKGRTNRLTSSTRSDQGHMERTSRRRWRNEEHPGNKSASEQVRSHFVSAHDAIGNFSTVQSTVRINEQGTKRKLSCDDHQTTYTITNHSEPFRTTIQANGENGQSNSLLKWLTDTGSDNEEIDYLSLLEADVPASVNQSSKDNTAQSNASLFYKPVGHLTLQQSAIQRQRSHDQARLTAASRLGDSSSDVTMTGATKKMSTNLPDKFPSRVQNSLDPFVEDFISSDSEISATEPGQESLLHTPSLTLSPQTLHADSDMDLNEATKHANAEIKIYLTQRQNNPDSYITKTGLTEMSSHETDFLNQLDYIMELQM